ncbi:MAG: restriction endonuclease subunit S [Sulfitobacter sp. SK025]|nr:MAG: restriction endonuclease subunit S [Sulfitobacter sp. SK025]
MSALVLPDDWSAKRLKYVATYNDEVLPESTEEDQEIDYVEISGVSLARGIEEVQRVAFGQAPSRARRKVRTGDILVSTVRTYLRAIAKVDDASPDLIASTGFCVVRPSDGVDSGFIGWVAKSEPFVSEVVARSVGVSYPAINASELVNIQVPLPPLETQRRIARFLDEKTAQIDGLIEKKRALLDRLAEKRQAIITRAVTKGLNHDAAMKPSGIDWLGDIPAHWAVKKLRYAAKNLNNMRVPIAAELRKGIDRTYPYYGASGIIDYVDEYIFDFATVLVAEDGANLLSRSTPLAFAADGKYWVNNHAHILKPKSMTIWFCSSVLAMYPLDPHISGSAQPKLTKDNLSALPVWVPPLGEQMEIEQEIAAQAAVLADVEIPLRDSVAKLEEYRVAIITAAVTGTIVGLQ